MRPSRSTAFVLRQIVIVVGAVIGYFGVRGLTEGEVATAERNAEFVLDLERSVGLAIEQQLQRALIASDLVVTIANWVYIWMHWPVLVATLIWLIVVNRDEYVELRNAMIISGLIGLVIFATFPVAPPRLLQPRIRRHRHRAVPLVSRAAAARLRERLCGRPESALRLESAGRDRLVPSRSFTVVAGCGRADAGCDGVGGDCHRQPLCPRRGRGRPDRAVRGRHRTVATGPTDLSSRSLRSRCRELRPRLGRRIAPHWRSSPLGRAWLHPETTKSQLDSWDFGVRPLGFEPRTNGLRVHCSAVELETVCGPGSVGAESAAHTAWTVGVTEGT